MQARRYLAALATILIVAAAWFGYGAYDRHSRRVTLAGDLNITGLPESIRIVRCVSSPNYITDIVYKCVLAIQKDDLPLLLSGYEYNRYGYAYEAWPKQFRHGGRVSIETNSSITRATIDVYIE